MKKHFLLNPEITFLNHGSFGACPKPVFKTYQAWQLELERQPVEFLGRRVTSLLAEAREKLAEYLNCAAQDVIYFPNPTTAINMVVRSLELHPGDEILTTDHEYGAMDRTWRYYCAKSGAKYIQRHIPLPVTSHAEFVEHFWAGVTPQTKIIFFSHITSTTALIFPAEELCRRAREAGILCIVDGAHAPAHIPLDLSALDADIYTGALHKWLMAPKGAAFLYARRDIQKWLDPLVVSWGYDSEAGYGSGNTFLDYHEWQGTRDFAAFLSVPAAINFQREQDWDQVRTRCRGVIRFVQQQVSALTGLPPICAYPEEWLGQMVALPFPAGLDASVLKNRLYDEYQIEIPFTQFEDQSFLRLSVQGYNTQQEIDYFLRVLGELLAE